MRKNHAVIAVLSGLLGTAAGVALAQDRASIKEGQQVFVRWCEGCHARGTPVQRNPGAGQVGRIWAGTYTLEQRYKGAVPAALEERTNLTPELIRTVVRNGLNVMPRTRKTELSDEQLDALIAYLVRSPP